jgi:hypothetical protein
VLTHHVVDEGTRQRHRGVGVDRDKELPLLWGDLPEFNRPLSVIGPDRRLADAGIIDQDIDKPETVARLGNDPVDRLVACKIGLNRLVAGPANESQHEFIFASIWTDADALKARFGQE